MSGEPDERHQDRSGPDENIRQSVPLELTGESGDGARPVAPPEGATRAPPREVLPAPPEIGAGARWLSRWLLFTGTSAAALSVASIGLAMRESGGTAAWRGGLIAFDCAVVILVLRSLLMHGVPAGKVCQRLFGGAGVTASALLLQVAWVRAAIGFVRVGPGHDLLAQVFVYGVLGLAGVIVFVQCLRDRPWACRTAAVSAAVLLGMVAAQPFTGYALFHGLPAVGGGSGLRPTTGLAVVAICAAAFTLLREPVGAEGRRPWALRLLAAAFLLATVAAAALLAARLAEQVARRQGAPHLAGTVLWIAALSWAAAALVPLVVAGADQAWRRRGRLGQDMVDSVHFMWLLVGLGGAGCLALWLPGRWPEGTLQRGLLVCGVLAGMLGAWLGSTRRGWAGRWALLPASGLAAAVICTFPQLIAFARKSSEGVGIVWIVATCTVWSCLVTSLVFAAIGLYVHRRRLRMAQPRRAAEGEVHLLATAGVAAGALLLALWFARVAGDASVRDALRQGLTAARLLVADMLALNGFQEFAPLVKRCGSYALYVLGTRAGVLGMGMALFVALGAHLLAASRVRWSYYVLTALWIVPLVAWLAFLLLEVWRLFFPVHAPHVVTPVGRILAETFAARLLLAAVLATLFIRAAEAYGTMLRLAARRSEPPERAPGPAGPNGPRMKNSHLAFLVRAGAYASVLGLGATLLLYAGPRTNAVPYQFGLLGAHWLSAVQNFVEGIGACMAEWTGYAVAGLLVAYLLVAVHEDARQGRPEAYPLVAGCWLLLLMPHVLGWMTMLRASRRPFEAGRSTALVLAAMVLAVLLVAACMLLWRWWRLVRSRPDADEEPEASDDSGAAHALGSVGLAAWFLVFVVALYVAFTGRQPAAALTPALGSLANSLALSVESVKYRLQNAGSLSAVTAGVAFASVLLLALHMLSRRRVAWARTALCIFWSGVILLSVGAAGYVLSRHPLGQWSRGELAAGLLAAAVLARVLLALANGRSWLLERPREP